MADDDSLLRIACRLVCTDQWLVTHVDSSWPIVHLKHFLLHKFYQTAFDPDHNPHAISVSPRKARRRSLSPITFAAPPVLSKTRHPSDPNSEDSGVLDDPGEVDLDDDVNITKVFTDAHRYKYNARPSTSSTSDSTPPTVPFDGGHDPQAYVLLTFSTTQVLEDRFSLSWYGVHPNELLELHPASISFVSLPRSTLDAYVAPYFAARVWALRWSDPLSKGDDNFDAKGTGHREKPKKKVAVEWKERWAIIHQGVFSLCKERHDTHVIFSAPLSSMLCIRDSAHFNLPLHTSRLRQKASSSSSASNMVCIKFSASPPVRHRTFSNESTVRFERRPSDPHGQFSAPLTSISTSSGGQNAWWRRGSRDVSATLSLGLASSASALVGSALVGSTGGAGFGDVWDTLAKRGSRVELDDFEEERAHGKDKYKGKERDEGEDTMWIVLDMLDSSTCSHILRILHWQAPSMCSSTFLPTRPVSTYSPAPSPIVFSSRSSTPASPISPTTPGPTSSYTFPPTPLSPTPTGSSSFPSTTHVPDKAHHIGPSNDTRPSSPALAFSSISSGHGQGVSYPDWRLGLVRAARRAGLGSVGRAMELVMFGDEDEDEMADVEDAEDDELTIEWARRNSTFEPSLADVLVAPRAPDPMQRPGDSGDRVRSSIHALPEEGTAPELGSELDVDTQSEFDSHAPLHRRSHPIVDLTSLLDADADLDACESDDSQAEWDGWVDALVAQRRHESLVARAQAHHAALARSEAIDIPAACSGGDTSRSSMVWSSRWSMQFGGEGETVEGTGSTPSPGASRSMPEPEPADDETGAWSWPRSSVEVNSDQSSGHSSERNANATKGASQRRTASSSAKTRGRGQSRGSGRILSSYSSVDSLLRRTVTMRTNIKSISLNQVKRSSMHVLFPSASSSDVHESASGSGNAQGERSASASPPPPPHVQLSRPSLGSLRSVAASNMSMRTRPLSPLSSQVPGHDEDHEAGLDPDGEEVEEAEEADMDDVEEADDDGEAYESELANPAQALPLPGMRMVPAGYTTFQHSSLYGGLGGSGLGSGSGPGSGSGSASGGEESAPTHAGVAHGQSMQRLPMGMARMMTTVSSTVSVGPARSARRGGR